MRRYLSRFDDGAATTGYRSRSVQKGMHSRQWDFLEAPVFLSDNPSVRRAIIEHRFQTDG
jgi:hypothetical protein